MAPRVIMHKFRSKKSRIMKALSRFLLLALLFSLCGAQKDSLTYTVQEERSAGTLVGNVSTDSGMTSAVASDVTLTYRLAQQPSTASRYFTLDNQTGQLKTAIVLDREEICPFSSTCELEAAVVVRSSDGQFFRTVNIKILLQDINDNAPTFPSPTISLVIPESVSVPQSYRIPAATDRDQGLMHGVQSYEILVGNETFGVSSAKNLDGSETLSLVVRSLLDRELRDHYLVVVAARDGGTIPRTGYVEINVTISDVNDNPPVFPVSEYNVSVNESAPVNSTVTTVSATDDDVGDNGKVTYRLSARSSSDVTSFFAVNPSTGEIRTTAPLGSRQGETVRIVVEGIDGGTSPLVAQVLVLVHVLDSVNNPPEIKLAFLAGGDTKAVVPESATQGFVVAHFLVEDADTGQNGQVSCSMTAEYFELQQLKDTEFKVVVKRPLDRERYPEISVIVTCEDNGKPPLSTSEPITVVVDDVNDNDPVFEMTSYSVDVMENVTVGTVLLRVVANDPDAGDNGNVAYEIVQPTDVSRYVVMHPIFGNITTTRKLDRETTTSFRFSVAAIDMGVPRRRSVASVTINLLDVNDNAPSFEEPLVFTVLENSEINKIIGRVQASDPDEGSNAELAFHMADPNAFFNLSREGVLTTLAGFDRESKAKYDFDVVVSDGGSPSLSSSTIIVVFIEDVNDNAPVFVFPKKDNDTVILGASTPQGSFVVNVTAYDKDDGVNARLQYTLEDADKLFSINATSGEVLTTREVMTSDIKTYTLRVRVQDGGDPSLTSTAMLRVDVARSNATASASDSGGTNALVVGLLVGFTLIVAACVVVIIVFIRRTDRRRSNAKAPPSSPSNTYAAAAHVDVPREVKVNGVYDVTPSRNSVCDDVSKGDLSSMHVTFMDLGQRDNNDGNNGGDQHDASADDMLSHASGETTTTDSGRGASESESNSRSQRSGVIGTDDFRFTVREFRKFLPEETPSSSRDELSSMEYKAGIARAAQASSLGRSAQGRPLLLGGDSDLQRRTTHLQDNVMGRQPHQNGGDNSGSKRPDLQGRLNRGFETNLDEVMELPGKTGALGREKKRQPIQYCGDLLTRGYSFEGSTCSGQDTPRLTPGRVEIDLSSSCPTATFRPGDPESKNNFRSNPRPPAKASNFRTHSRSPPHPCPSVSSRNCVPPPVPPPRSKLGCSTLPSQPPPAYLERSKVVPGEGRPPFCTESHADAVSQGEGGEDDRSSSTSGSYTIEPLDSLNFQVAHVYV